MNINRVIGLDEAYCICSSSEIQSPKNFIAFEGNDTETMMAISAIEQAIKSRGGSDEEVFKTICQCVMEINAYEAQATAVGGLMPAVRTIARNARMVTINSILEFCWKSERPNLPQEDVGFRTGRENIPVPVEIQNRPVLPQGCYTGEGIMQQIQQQFNLTSTEIEEIAEIEGEIQQLATTIWNSR